MRLTKDQGMTSEEALTEFNGKTKERQKKLQEKLQSIDGISRSTIDELIMKVLPAGKDSNEPLFGNQDWLSELWAEMLTRVKAEAQNLKAVFRLNADRLREPEEVTEEDRADSRRPSNTKSEEDFRSNSCRRSNSYRC